MEAEILSIFLAYLKAFAVGGGRVRSRLHKEHLGRTFLRRRIRKSSQIEIKDGRGHMSAAFALKIK